MYDRKFSDLLFDYRLGLTGGQSMSFRHPPFSETRLGDVLTQQGIRSELFKVAVLSPHSFLWAAEMFPPEMERLQGLKRFF